MQEPEATLPPTEESVDPNNSSSTPEAGIPETPAQPQDPSTLEVNTPLENKEQSIDYQKEMEEWKDKYLRLASDFDNFRKRSQKEKSELIKYAGEDLIKSLLPVVDDFDRSLLVMEKSDNVSALKEGIQMISHKFRQLLINKGLKPMDSIQQSFNSEFHEAITTVPGPEELKGVVIDEVEKGYFLEDKVLRYAKVIVGA
jgi:molecular chaperone GrpE